MIVIGLSHPPRHLWQKWWLCAYDYDSSVFIDICMMYSLYATSNQRPLSLLLYICKTTIISGVPLEWIWKCIMKEKRHNSPVLIISLLMCWVLYLCFSGFYTGFIYITFPVLAFLGWLVNLAFSAVWYHVQNRKATMPNAGEVGDASTALTSPLLEEEERADQPVQDDVETPTTIIETTTQPPAKKTTVDYINNIKIFLTCMVILQHCFGGLGGTQELSSMEGRSSMSGGEMGWGYKVLNIFIGMNDSYFMSLFFFYSGYFVPKSYDKKGRYGFLFGRMKRLGIPFVVFTL